MVGCLGGGEGKEKEERKRKRKEREKKKEEIGREFMDFFSLLKILGIHWQIRF